MRAIWTGAIGFGLVNIPVKIYSATQSSSLDLDMLDRNPWDTKKVLWVPPSSLGRHLFPI